MAPYHSHLDEILRFLRSTVPPTPEINILCSVEQLEWMAYSEEPFFRGQREFEQDAELWYCFRYDPFLWLNHTMEYVSGYPGVASNPPSRLQSFPSNNSDAELDVAFESLSATAESTSCACSGCNGYPKATIGTWNAENEAGATESVHAHEDPGFENHTTSKRQSELEDPDTRYDGCFSDCELDVGADNSDLPGLPAVPSDPCGYANQPFRGYDSKEKQPRGYEAHYSESSSESYSNTEYPVLPEAPHPFFNTEAPHDTLDDDGFPPYNAAGFEDFSGYNPADYEDFPKYTPVYYEYASSSDIVEQTQDQFTVDPSVPVSALAFQEHQIPVQALCLDWRFALEFPM